MISAAGSTCRRGAGIRLTTTSTSGVHPGVHLRRSPRENPLIVDWIAARANAGPTQVAHTTPVYVTVAEDGFHNRATLIEQIDVSKRYLAEIRELLPASQDEATVPIRAGPRPARCRGTVEQLRERVVEAEATLEKLRSKP